LYQWLNDSLKNNQIFLPGLVFVWHFEVYVMVTPVLILTTSKSGQPELKLVRPLHRSGHYSPLHGSIHYALLGHLSVIRVVDFLSLLMVTFFISPDRSRKSKILQMYSCEIHVGMYVFFLVGQARGKQQKLLMIWWSDFLFFLRRELGRDWALLHRLVRQHLV
jgi:hypothetical protein